MQVKFYKNVSKENAAQGKNSNGVVVADGSIIFAKDGKIYLKDTAGVTVYGADNLPEAYKNYLDDQLLSTAKSKLKATISLSHSSCVADKLPASQTATLSITFDGKAVNADTVPATWSQSTTGKYTKTLQNVKDSTGSATITYTVPDGDYKGLKLTTTAAAAQMHVSYPAWYGMSVSKDKSIISEFIKTATRTETSVNQSDFTWTNSLPNSAYGIILTHGNATAKQSGISILNTVATGISVVSNNQTMPGYTMYATSKTIASNGSAEKVELKINI